MSDKQLLRAAIEGRRLEFKFDGSFPLCGYLGGVDDFHWMVVAQDQGPDGTCSVYLIHKSAPLWIRITDCLLDDEGNAEKIRKITGPFVQSVEVALERSSSRPEAIAS